MRHVHSDLNTGIDKFRAQALQINSYIAEHTNSHVQIIKGCQELKPCPSRKYLNSEKKRLVYILFSPCLSLPITSNAEIKERVQLYLYSPAGPSWPVLGWNSHLPFTCLSFLSSKNSIAGGNLQETNSSSYSSVAGKSLGLQQKNLFYLTSFLSYVFVFWSSLNSCLGPV